MPGFKLVSDYQAKGDQPAAIARLAEWIGSGRPHTTLLGVTGSGKTFTVASVIERLQRRLPSVTFRARPPCVSSHR